MLLNFRKNRWQLVIISTIAVIPVIITIYQIMVTDKDSIVFLEGFHPFVVVAVIIYYLLLLVIGVVWIILQIKSMLKLKNENVKNELLHLQSQVNPHFFFNTLNNLYGLIDDDSEKAKALILKLSELMRYSIYEGERKTVTFEEEITYLKTYIELHKMRYHKNIDVIFNYDDEILKYQITPLLYIILLENAFKHGVENIRKNAFVHINLAIDMGVLSFEIKNNYDPAQLPDKPGIGIKNLKRRLALIYPNKHELTFAKTASVYSVKLQLEQ